MENLNIQMENLISKNSPDFEISKLIKTHVNEYLDSLDNIFDTTHGKAFFIKHTKKIDYFIQIIYKYLLRKHFGNFVPMSNSIPIALIALGSYGREQLCVYSDIDIMILYKKTAGYNLKPLMENFITLAWDSGLKLGSRVNDIDEVLESSKQDITIKSSILESRFIYGSKTLWFYYQSTLQEIRSFNQKEFILEKIEEHSHRLLKYPLDMQPNIKDGYGGMREANVIFWIATVIANVSNIKNLVNIYFSEEEYKKYRISLEYIFKVRNALHLISKKKLDQINFDILPQLSLKLDFVNTKTLTKERQCMTKLFLCLHNIHVFVSIMTKKLIRPYIFENKNISYLKKYRIKNNFYIVEGKVYTSYNAKPNTLVDILNDLNRISNEVYKFDNSYLYLVSKTIKNKNINKNEKNLLIQLFNKENLYPILKLLYNSNIISHLIPPFTQILNQPQFDGYHRHPVDIHTINSIKCLQNIKDDFILDIYEKLTKEKKFLLRLAIFFHDIGKGRGFDHNNLGESLFKKYSKHSSIDVKDISFVARLIKHHNIMTQVATREDIYSQKVILKFISMIQDIDTLNLLMILTYADINAVAGHIYKSNTASLLKELYYQSIPAFENKELIKVSSRRIAKENAIKKNKTYLILSKSLQKKLLSIESTQLFLKYKSADILSIAIKANSINTMEYEITNDSMLVISIIRLLPLNLGYLLGKLQFLDIQYMGIYKLYDNKKFFRIQFDKNVDISDLPYLNEIIEQSLDMSRQISFKKPNILKSEIQIDCNHTEDLALISINTTNQQGLFGFIALILDQFGVEINSAKIYTKANKVNDMLLVEKNDKFWMHLDDILNALSI